MNNYNYLLEKHNELEGEVLEALFNEIENSKLESKSVSTKAIKVNIFDYVELVIIDDELTFIDSRGLQYSVFADCNLTDLIEILNK